MGGLVYFSWGKQDQSKAGKNPKISKKSLFDNMKGRINIMDIV